MPRAFPSPSPCWDSQPCPVGPRQEFGKWKCSTLRLMSFDVLTPWFCPRETTADSGPPRSYLLGRYHQYRVFSASWFFIHKDLVCGSRSPSGLAAMQILTQCCKSYLTDVKNLEVERLPFSFWCVFEPYPSFFISPTYFSYLRLVFRATFSSLHPSPNHGVSDPAQQRSWTGC